MPHLDTAGVIVDRDRVTPACLEAHRARHHLIRHSSNDERRGWITCLETDNDLTTDLRRRTRSEPTSNDRSQHYRPNLQVRPKGRNAHSHPAPPNWIEDVGDYGAVEPEPLLTTVAAHRADSSRKYHDEYQRAYDEARCRCGVRPARCRTP